MRRLALLGLLFLIALSVPALGDALYTFSVESRGGLEESVQTGKVFAADTSYRIELGPRDGELPLYPIVVSKDGGEHETAIAPARRFYYSPKQGSGPTSALFSLFPVRPLSRSVTNLQFTVLGQDEPEPVSGMKTHEVEIRLSYDIKMQLSKTETVTGKVSLNAKYWMAEDREVLVPVRLRPALRSGIPEIDSRLSGALAKLRGLPVKQEVTISTESPGSDPQKTVVTRTIRDLHTVAAKTGRFEVPKGFQYHEPQLSRAMPPDHPQIFGPEKTPPPGD
jgi:hypothetical protein